MSISNIFGISGSAMAAENIRLNVTASNLANAQNVGSDEQTTYRAREPVFSTLMNPEMGDEEQVAGVRVDRIAERQGELLKEYNPGHPLADAEGFITNTNVNTVEEMSNLIAASRAYQNNVEVMKTAKDLMMKTLELGQ
ncbi:MAG: flagellar basal body rod protein FlgC [Gammaproteobacteria bacterium]|nr:flagellar basal body rod protein FlgC [Gammaproteobacteria bacterium]